ncbi:MAG: helix-turn-helix domain-containing protein [Myxococcota bacterium]
MWRATLQPTSLLSPRELVDALPGQASDVESWVAQHVRPAAMIGTEPVYAWAEVLHALPRPLTTNEPVWPIHELNGPAPLLTTDDVCARLRISRRQLYSLTQRDELPHIRIGRQLRFHPESIERWLKADPRVAQVLADPKAKPTQGTTTPPTDARSLVSLARRYAKARKALQTTLTTTLTSQEPQALPSALKKVLAIHNDYIQALKVVPEPAEKLHVALMLADIQWNIALDLAQSPTPNTLNAEQADTYRAIMSQDVIKPSLLRALATYRGARTIARKHALSLPPLVTVRIAVLEVLETPEP